MVLLNSVQFAGEELFGLKDWTSSNCRSACYAGVIFQECKARGEDDHQEEVVAVAIAAAEEAIRWGALSLFPIRMELW